MLFEKFYGDQANFLSEQLNQEFRKRSTPYLLIPEWVVCEKKRHLKVFKLIYSQKKGTN